jgi:hypothetical protein
MAATTREPIAFGRIMLAAHQGSIIEATAAPFAMRVDMIDSEVLPG